MSADARPPQPLHAPLDEYARQYQDLARDAERLTDGLSDRQLSWSPAPGRWSIGDCLAHLNAVAGPYADALEASVARAREQGLATGAINSATVNGIHALTGCVVRGRCPGMEQLPAELGRMLLENPGLRGGRRNRVLRDMARIAYHLEEDPEAAVSWLRRAASQSPADVSTRVELAYYLALQGKRGEALVQLDAAAELDPLKKKAHTLSNLRLAVMSGALSAPAPEG